MFILKIKSFEIKKLKIELVNKKYLKKLLWGKNKEQNKEKITL